MNSKFRCTQCRSYFPLVELHLTLPSGRFCSSACVGARREERRRKARGARRRDQRKAGTAVSRIIPLDVRRRVRLRDRRCRGCGDKGTQIHHITYRSQGGPDSEDNLILLCLTCHAELAHGAESRYWRQVFRAVLWMQYVDEIRLNARQVAAHLARLGLLVMPNSEGS